MRAIDPELSLHYWDWTTDPTKQQDLDGKIFSLFTPDFMGNARGVTGEPWLSGGFYDPNANPPRSNDPHRPKYNAAFVPQDLSRNVRSGRPIDPAETASKKNCSRRGAKARS